MNQNTSAGQGQKLGTEETNKVSGPLKFRQRTASVNVTNGCRVRTERTQTSALLIFMLVFM